MPGMGLFIGKANELWSFEEEAKERRKMKDQYFLSPAVFCMRNCRGENPLLSIFSPIDSIRIR